MQTQPNPSFQHFDWSNSLLFDNSNGEFPTRLWGLTGSNTFHFNDGSTYFIYQYAGYSYIDGVYPLLKQHFASAASPRNSYIHGNDDCQAIIVERIGTTGIFQLGGPIEQQGRLKYIDGCTDSLLIAPWKYGEPCLNHLHFPEGIKQTAHTHPSIRIGVVAKGSGICITPFGNIRLKEGMIFAILPHCHVSTEYRVSKELVHAIGWDGAAYPIGTHCFETGYEGGMHVIAYHPDSDFGPRDEDHPMVNKTIVAGISAKDIPEIRTQ